MAGPPSDRADRRRARHPPRRRPRAGKAQPVRPVTPDAVVSALCGHLRSTERPWWLIRGLSGGLAAEVEAAEVEAGGVAGALVLHAHPGSTRQQGRTCST